MSDLISRQATIDELENTKVCTTRELHSENLSSMRKRILLLYRHKSKKGEH